MEKIKNLFQNVEWKFAKTMANIPHWYIVRWDYPELDTTCVEVVKYIREVGEERDFYGVKYIYLDIGDWMLWTEGDPIHDDPIEARTHIYNTTFILNIADCDGKSPDLVNPNQIKI